jgi:hypothetical protein
MKFTELLGLGVLGLGAIFLFIKLLMILGFLGISGIILMVGGYFILDYFDK